ncbi:MAG: hypothetical protein KC656_29985, partial [Myxococcales bacterium]|nr:hypothetical protein [Myxococcales bacterium]
MHLDLFGYGFLAVFEPERVRELPGGLFGGDPDGDLQDVYDARAAIVFRFDDEDFVRLDRVDELPPRLEGFAQAEIVTEGRLALGTVESFQDGPQAELQVERGAYRVTVWRTGPGGYALHLQRVPTATLSPPRGSLDLAAKGPSVIRGQVDDSLVDVARTMGATLGRFAAETRGTWSVKDRLALPIPADLEGDCAFVVFAGDVRWPGPSTPWRATHTLRHEVDWPDGEDRGTNRQLWARVRMVDGEVTEVAFWSQGLTAAVALEQALRAGARPVDGAESPSGEGLPAEMKWSSDKVEVRVRMDG